MSYLTLNPKTKQTPSKAKCTLNRKSPIVRKNWTPNYIRGTSASIAKSKAAAHLLNTADSNKAAVSPIAEESANNMARNPLSRTTNLAENKNNATPTKSTKPIATKKHPVKSTTLKSSPNNQASISKPNVKQTPSSNSKFSENRAIWNRNPLPNKLAKANVSSEKSETKPEVQSISIQTNEAEILNHLLLVDDVKYMCPSKSIVREIERRRQEIKRKQMLKTQRKFEEHSSHQETHLNDLKEFLETSCIKKKPRNLRDCLNVNHKVITSMDELLTRDLPQVEPVDNIKARIKRKEEELLTIFDNIYKSPTSS